MGFDQSLCDIVFAPNEQLDYIGYSYGSLLAAHTTLYYANLVHKVDNLVLIGSPISQKFLDLLNTNENIGNVIVKNLDFAGDGIYAGMSQLALMATVPGMAMDVLDPDGEGHFYYSPDTEVGRLRRDELAEELHDLGLR